MTKLPRFEEIANQIANEAIASRTCCRQIPSCETAAWKDWLAKKILEALKEASAPPPSLVEALNSGDGSYRP